MRLLRRKRFNFQSLSSWTMSQSRELSEIVRFCDLLYNFICNLLTWEVLQLVSSGFFWVSFVKSNFNQLLWNNLLWVIGFKIVFMYSEGKTENILNLWKIAKNEIFLVEKSISVTTTFYFPSSCCLLEDNNRALLELICINLQYFINSYCRHQTTYYV